MPNREIVYTWKGRPIQELSREELETAYAQLSDRLHDHDRWVMENVEMEALFEAAGKAIKARRTGEGTR